MSEFRPFSSPVDPFPRLEEEPPEEPKEGEGSGGDGSGAADPEHPGERPQKSAAQPWKQSHFFVPDTMPRLPRHEELGPDAGGEPGADNDAPSDVPDETDPDEFGAGEYPTERSDAYPGRRRDTPARWRFAAADSDPPERPPDRQAEHESPERESPETWRERPPTRHEQRLGEVEEPPERRFNAYVPGYDGPAHPVPADRNGARDMATCVLVGLLAGMLGGLLAFALLGATIGWPGGMAGAAAEDVADQGGQPPGSTLPLDPVGPGNPGDPDVPEIPAGTSAGGDDGGTVAAPGGDKSGTDPCARPCARRGQYGR